MAKSKKIVVEEVVDQEEVVEEPVEVPKPKKVAKSKKAAPTEAEAPKPKKATKKAEKVVEVAEETLVEEAKPKRAKKPKKVVVEEPSDDASEEENKSQEKRSRARPTVESHNEKYALIFEDLDKEIERRSDMKEKGVRVLKGIKKRLERMQKEVLILSKTKRPRNPDAPKRKGGFMMEKRISEELAKFLHLDPETLINRVDATNAICYYARVKDGENRESMKRWESLNPDGKRNLQDPNNKKAILPDKALKKLLHYDEYVKDVKAGKVTKKSRNKETGSKEDVLVDDHQLYYWTVQKLINRHFVKGEDAEDEE